MTLLDTPPRRLADEILALDLLTLRDHTERAGDRIDPVAHRRRLDASIESGAACVVRRNGGLAAYALLRRESAARWFVTGLSTHPAHRTITVVGELLAQLAALAARMGIEDLVSHVYKTNRLSMAFHRKLGFRITRENDKGVEFQASVATLAGHPAVRRVVDKHRDAARRSIGDPHPSRPDTPAFTPPGTLLRGIPPMPDR
ncbi:GNAT family N-acetyltransferase [Burkholderia alba]|uniref:GNAT family N-acetyltransferase n=1 Tax=Burkholderia alba TaxID=2683677 RepID=UPI002B0574CE|nr:GNAT family N-acetyltransferase [Burkholderia alba]